MSSESPIMDLWGFLQFWMSYTSKHLGKNTGDNINGKTLFTNSRKDNRNVQLK